MADIQFNTTPDQGAFVLHSKEMDLEAGWLGRFFGSGTTAPLNIAGLLVFLLGDSGVAVLFFQNAIPTNEYWKIFVSLSTYARYRLRFWQKLKGWLAPIRCCRQPFA
jgi:hypothetical protein